MREKFEIFGEDSTATDLSQYVSVFEEYGVVVFRGFFAKDTNFWNYYNDIKELALTIAKKHGVEIDRALTLNRILTILSETNRDEVGNLYDLGTRPIKLLSGVQLKSCPTITNFVKTIMGDAALLGFPYLGETLHIFPPGIENTKYNLPMHQDYPYIMQSPQQITAYINLGELQDENNGGIRVWAGSHKDGISPSTIAEGKHRVTTNKDYFQDNYKSYDISFDVGDFAVFDSLLQHEGIRNLSNCSRVVQLVRYSNLMNYTSISYSWKSTDPRNSKGIKFEDVHSFRDLN